MKKLLIIGYNWPEPATTAAGVRMMQLLRCFREAGYQQTFASTAAASSYTADLKAEGIQTRTIRINDSSFDAFVKELQPDVVLFDRFHTEEQFGWRVEANAPDALRVLDTEDLHSLRNARKEALTKDRDFSLDAWLQQDLTYRELASIWRSDLSLVISSYEYSLLKDQVKIDSSLLVLVPFMTSTVNTITTDFNKRKDFICIGNGKHHPNMDAVQYLYKKIWPGLKKLIPDACIRVYGAYLPKAIQQLHQPAKGFLVEGWVEDAKKAMENARVQLAPLQYGAGIKGKLLLSMQVGTPSVTTSIGAEGMHDGLPWNGCIADEPEDFIRSAADLYTDKTLWINSVEAGKTILDAKYNRDLWEPKLISTLSEIHRSLRAHRAKNLFGSILRHHSMAATKYMSKWIEAKNNNQAGKQG
ncbi:glycosyltransferase [Zeaxanthinibacter sp. PT1]|uniref:glycosyltransferase n=1 Tax=Zeaxanthinibacter TaxID=561554 RepID=UPI00234958E1|nr:glycosyltransferase [Zeaxanthinibacter sp. PT1]MDC6351529.1 glycosyltransferase [Zeaxanthinibacter sp. PT1]